MSQVTNNCQHLNTKWVDVTSSITGEPMRSGYCPDCKHVALVPKAQHVISLMMQDAGFAAEVKAGWQAASAPQPAGELNPLLAKDHARKCLQYVRAFSGQSFNSALDSPDHQNLAMALDHLEEAAAMLLNLSERVTPEADSFLNAAKAFAEAHIAGDEIDAREDGAAGPPVTDEEFEAADVRYNSTKRALVAAYKSLGSGTVKS